MMTCEWLTCLPLNLLLWGDARYAVSKAAGMASQRSCTLGTLCNFRWLQGEGCLDVQLSGHSAIDTELI